MKNSAKTVGQSANPVTPSDLVALSRAGRKAIIEIRAYFVNHSSVVLLRETQAFSNFVELVTLGSYPTGAIERQRVIDNYNQYASDSAHPVVVEILDDSLPTDDSFQVSGYEVKDAEFDTTLSVSTTRAASSGSQILSSFDAVSRQLVNIDEPFSKIILLGDGNINTPLGDLGGNLSLNLNETTSVSDDGLTTRSYDLSHQYVPWAPQPDTPLKIPAPQPYVHMIKHRPVSRRTLFQVRPQIKYDFTGFPVLVSYKLTDEAISFSGRNGFDSNGRLVNRNQQIMMIQPLPDGSEGLPMYSTGYDGLSIYLRSQDELNRYGAVNVISRGSFVVLDSLDQYFDELLMNSIVLIRQDSYFPETSRENLYFDIATGSLIGDSLALRSYFESVPAGSGLAEVSELGNPSAGFTNLLEFLNRFGSYFDQIGNPSFQTKTQAFGVFWLNAMFKTFRPSTQI